MIRVYISEHLPKLPQISQNFPCIAALTVSNFLNISAKHTQKSALFLPPLGHAEFFFSALEDCEFSVLGGLFG